VKVLDCTFCTWPLDPFVGMRVVSDRYGRGVGRVIALDRARPGYQILVRWARYSVWHKMEGTRNENCREGELRAYHCPHAHQERDSTFIRRNRYRQGLEHRMTRQAA
jgi:hypothetical protein